MSGRKISMKKIEVLNSRLEPFVFELRHPSPILEGRSFFHSLRSFKRVELDRTYALEDQNQLRQRLQIKVIF